MDGTGTTTFTYDALNRLTAAAYPGTYGSWSWVYDPVGNRISQTAPSGTTPYTYDENNRLTAAGAVNYSYDANGNLTGTTAGQSFSWDVFNRLTQASGSGGQVSYTYNGDGLKMRRAGPEGGATVYYYDGIRPIWEADGAGTPHVQLDRDIFGNLLSRREVSSGIRRYFAHDGLGGLTATTDEAGTHLASLFYDAWGNLRATGGTWTAGNYRFTGAELDSATGLYHMGARFYDPGIGRWISEDPVQDDYFNVSSLNYYTYVFNSPTNLLDPTGRSVAETLKKAVRVIPDLVREAGKDAQRVLSEFWQALGELADALLNLSEEFQYLDANIIVGVIPLGPASVAGTGGAIGQRGGQRFIYAGVALTSPGFQGSITISRGSVTTGWNVAISGNVSLSSARINSVAFQLGTAIRCFNTCGYLEVGAGRAANSGIAIMLFKVWQLR